MRRDDCSWCNKVEFSTKRNSLQLVLISFSSDLAVWRGDFERSAGGSQNSLTILGKMMREKFVVFLRKNGFTGSTISINPPTVNKEYNNEYGTDGQMTSILQDIETFSNSECQSNNVDQIEKGIVKLRPHRSWVTLSSYTPSYYYANSQMKLTPRADSTNKWTKQMYLPENSHQPPQTQKCKYGCLPDSWKKFKMGITVNMGHSIRTRAKRATNTVRAEYVIEPNKNSKITPQRGMDFLL